MVGDRAGRPRPDGLRPGVIGGARCFFYFRSDLLIDAVREEQQHQPMKKMTINETPNEIQTPI
jgi:hypothetical protein